MIPADFLTTAFYPENAQNLPRSSGSAAGFAVAGGRVGRGLADGALGAGAEAVSSGSNGDADALTVAVTIADAVAVALSAGGGRRAAGASGACDNQTALPTSPTTSATANAAPIVRPTGERDTVLG